MDYQVYHLAGMQPNPADIALLDEHERKVFSRRGDSYLIIRSLLKREIARRLACSPEEVTLEIGEHGKPTHPHYHFNISHSGDYLCMAFHHSDIGVDIERVRPRPFARVASRFMAPEQLQAFCDRGCPEAEFFACWCTAEALIKQAGATIWQARDFPFLFDQGRIIPLFENAPVIYLFTPAPGYCGAIAYAEDSSTAP